MQRLQMNSDWEWGLISQIKSRLAFSFFNFSKTTLLQLGVYYCGIMILDEDDDDDDDEDDNDDDDDSHHWSLPNGYNILLSYLIFYFLFGFYILQKFT